MFYYDNLITEFKTKPSWIINHTNSFQKVYTCKLIHLQLLTVIVTIIFLKLYSDSH